MGTIVKFNVIRDAQTVCNIRSGVDMVIFRRNHAYSWYPGTILATQQKAFAFEAAGIYILEDNILEGFLSEYPFSGQPAIGEIGEQMMLRTGMMMIVGLVCVSGVVAGTTGFRDDGAGRYPSAVPPTVWSPDKGVVWKTALPDRSNASPILTKNRIFVCAEPATMVCLSVADGRILWQSTVSKRPDPPPKTHNVNGYTSATPCSDGKRVWAVFGQGVVACWDVSGKKLWSVTLEKPPHGWGGCVSPRLAGGMLIVQFNNMFGLDPATGAVRWKLKTAWGWGSPVVAKVGGRDILYTCKGSAVDAVSGKELIKGLVALEYNSPALVDGVLYYLQGNPQAYALPTKPEDKPPPLWTAAKIKGDRYYGTPLVHDGLVYAINRAKNLSVVDQKTGALIYEKKVDFLQGTVYPSPTLAGDLVFLSSERGQTVVIKPGREYSEVARNVLEIFRSTPVFSGTRMYIRGEKNMWCIGR